MQSNISGVVAYALGVHNGGQKLKQFGSKDGVKIMKAFKNEAQDILTAIHQQLHGFDHIQFAKGAPDIGIEPMSSEEFYQFVNLFFRRGLYWEPPHPALVNLTFPDLALRKKPKVDDCTVPKPLWQLCHYGLKKAACQVATFNLASVMKALVHTHMLH